MQYPINPEDRKPPKLPPGWRILANRPMTPVSTEICDYVLGINDDGHHYATWVHNLDIGGITSGHYHTKWRDAVECFRTRGTAEHPDKED